jgi:hypothetical protein
MGLRSGAGCSRARGAKPCMPVWFGCACEGLRGSGVGAVGSRLRRTRVQHAVADAGRRAARPFLSRGPDAAHVAVWVSMCATRRCATQLCSMSPKKKQKQGRQLTEAQRAERVCSICEVPVPGAFTWLDPDTAKLAACFACRELLAQVSRAAVWLLHRACCPLPRSSPHTPPSLTQAAGEDLRPACAMWDTAPGQHHSPACSSQRSPEAAGC